MTSAERRGISSDHVRGPSGTNVADLECCICRDLLWKPVACQTCETPFCSPCITQWLINNPKKCPNRCESYIERKCPPFIAKLLAQLQISCFYQSNGCEQVSLYEALEKHEIECDYQLQQCPGCQLQILKKDFVKHEDDCVLIEWVCEDCKLVYKRCDAAAKHTENTCLREQLRQLRNESKQNKQELQKLISQWNKICTMNPEFTKVTIKFDDLSNAIEKEKAIPIGGSTQIAYFKVDASINIDRPDDAFTFVSLTVCAAWNDDLQLTITGHRNLIQSNTHVSTLLFGKPQLILLNWKNIDKVTFKSSGGTVHPESGQSALPHVVLTQLTIDPLD